MLRKLRRKRKINTQADAQPNRVFSYRSYRSQSQRNTGRLQQAESGTKKRPATAAGIRKWVPIASFIVIVACLLSTLVLGGEPGVRIVQSEGSVQLKDISRYDARIAEIWKGNFNNLTKLTAQTEKAREEIRQAFPEVSAAYIELPLLGRRPLVTLVMTPAVASLNNATGAYYISADGKVLGKINGEYQHAGSNKLVSITDNSGLQPKAGEYVLNADQVRTIRTYVQGLEQHDIRVAEVILPSVANEVDLRLAEKTYIVKFSLIEEPRQGVGAFLAAVEQFSAAGKPAEYVDVRVPEKVYYK